MYTQNIDTLERKANLSSPQLIEAHGSLYTAQCNACHFVVYDAGTRFFEELKQARNPKCPKCGEHKIEFQIVLYEDNLPFSFQKALKEDFESSNYCDVLLVLGTSLQVAPICGIPNMLPNDKIRVIVTKNVSDILQNSHDHPAYKSYWGKKKWKNELLIRDTSDNFVLITCIFLGWEKELEELIVNQLDNKKVQSEESSSFLSNKSLTNLIEGKLCIGNEQECIQSFLFYERILKSNPDFTKWLINEKTSIIKSFFKKILKGMNSFHNNEIIQAYSLNIISHLFGTKLLTCSDEKLFNTFVHITLEFDILNLCSKALTNFSTSPLICGLACLVLTYFCTNTHLRSRIYFENNLREILPALLETFSENHKKTVIPVFLKLLFCLTKKKNIEEDVLKEKKIELWFNSNMDVSLNEWIKSATKNEQKSFFLFLI